MVGFILFYNMKQLKKPKPTFNIQKGKWGIDFDIIKDGKVKRVQRHFIYNTEREAGIKARQRENEQNPKSTKARKSDLTNSQIKETLWAFEELTKMPFKNNTLRNAIIYFRENYKEANQTEPLSFCIEKYLEIKRSSIKTKPFNNTRQKLNHLLRNAGDVPLGEIDSDSLILYFEEIEEKTTKSTRENYLGLIGGFFDYATNPSNKNRWRSDNPIESVKWHFKQKYNRKIDKSNGEIRRPPKILQIGETKHAIKKAIKYEQFLFKTILELFFGLRPSEVEDIAETEDYWKYINLPDGYIYIDENIGKEADWREVKISKIGKLWLNFAKEQNLTLPKTSSHQVNKVYPKFRREVFLTDEQTEEFNRALEDNNPDKIKSYRHYLNHVCSDCFRHTFGTNLWYKTKSMNTVVAELGNSARVFIRHYKGALKPPSTYIDFWNLKPSDFGL